MLDLRNLGLDRQIHWEVRNRRLAEPGNRFWNSPNTIFIIQILHESPDLPG